MTTVICNACSMENDCNCAKCEHCKNNLLDANSPTTDDWENDFQYIEEAELRGEVYQLEGFDGGFCKLEPCQNDEIATQAFKEEPEIQINADAEEQMKLENTDDRSELIQYQCNACAKSFKRKALLTAHLAAVHPSTDEDSLEHTPRKKSRSTTQESGQLALKCPKNTPPSGLMKCNYCDVIFLNNFDFKMHQKQHEGKKIHRCDVCEVVLSNECVLRQHKTKLHSKNIVRPVEKYKFRCNFCDERFPLQIMLTNHKKTHVEYTTQIEETAFLHKVDGRLTYVCKACGKSSSNKSRHTDHVRVHTKEKPFKCDLCGLGFTARGSLVHHVRLHTGERAFQCHICEMTYRHKRSLRRHLLRHTGERPFKCQFCDKTFALSTTQKDHERLLHTGETPYNCEVCDNLFKTSYLLNAHRRKEHNIDTNSKRKVEILIIDTGLSESKVSGVVKR